jgi:RHS repeat-associated protein
VIPPLVTNVSTELDGLCYQYKYDYRNRLVEKKLPGKQWEYIVYDKLDRVVATGPAYNPWGGSDTNKGWLITKYDVFNRPVYIAWYTSTPVNSSSDRKKMQTGVDSSNILSESKSTATTTIDAVTTKYTNTVFPTSFKLLTVNYYDSYDFPNAPTIPSQIEGQNTQSTNLKGMPTGSWVRVLDNASSTTNETSYTVYDTRYRPIRSYTKNYLGGYTQVDTKLDWAGKILYTLTSQRRTNASELFTVKDRFEYSPQDRLTKHVQQLTSPTLLPEQLLTLNTYDELGQLTSKKVGGTDVTGAQALQAVDYSYNIRGWLKAINDVNTLGTDLFAFKINYNQKENGTAGLFNGNITETLWRTSADNIKRKYNYSYDNLNRLLQANYSKPDASTNLNNYKEWLNYDANGNITDIVRTGFMDPVAGTVENVIDNLKFVYDTASQNRLLKVNDLSNSPQGFKDNYASTANDFSYDNNGNMTADNNKGIGSIIYNHLNLPIKINFGVKGEITYLYNATGQKLQKFVKDAVSSTNTTTDYLSGFQYLNTTLQFFPHAEGYVHYTRPLSNSQLGSFNYVFNYTDHLGNVRVSFAKDPQQGNVLKILEENHYYAFGMKHENYNVTRVDFRRYPDTGVELVPMPAVANASYNYKYNGKELQEELGLNTYDYGFRHYMPDIGRMGNMDALAELAYDITPNRYCFNNPLRFIDPSGLWEETANGYATNKTEDIKRFMSYLNIENGALNNSPTSEQTSAFIEGEMSPGAHGKLSDGTILADELLITNYKKIGGGHVSQVNEKSFSKFWHGVQRSLTPDALDTRTLGQQFGGFGGLTYSGPSNPKTYSGNDDYSFMPNRIEDVPGMIHDLTYDKLKIKGAVGLFTAKSAIGADYKFVTQELAIAFTPAFSMRTRVMAGALGIGLGLVALPKTVYSVVNDAYQKVHESTK